MTNQLEKLESAVAEIQEYIDRGEPVPAYSHEELQLVVTAAWKFWDLENYITSLTKGLG